MEKIDRAVWHEVIGDGGRPSYQALEHSQKLRDFLLTINNEFLQPKHNVSI